MVAVARKQEVMTRLTNCSDLTVDAASRIYDEAMNLYHESFTYTSFYLLLETDEKIISAPRPINPISDSIGSCRIQPPDRNRLVSVGFR
jgi:hypothetical protein